MPKTTFIQQSRRVPASEKAAFHQYEGAGRSKVKREFLGLTSDDEVYIVERVSKHLDQVLKTNRG